MSDILHSGYFPVVVGLIGLVVIYVYYKWRGGKKGEKKEAIIVEQMAGEKKAKQKVVTFADEGIPCMIKDTISRRRYNAFITEEQEKAIIVEHGSLGRQWSRDAKKTFNLVKMITDTGDEILRPIFTSPDITHSATALYNDIQQQEIEYVVAESMKEEKDFFDKYAHYLWLLIALGVLLFLWSQA